MCELAKRITVPVSMDFMALSSYGNNTESSGNIKVKKELDESIEGKEVLIVEDIVDSGRTLSFLVEELKSVAVILYSIVSISGAILQAFGHVNLPLISLTVGGIVKCVLNAVLVGVESVNIMGAPIATVACYVVMITMNLIFLRKYLAGCAVIIWNTAKTAAASLIMGVSAYFAFGFLSDLIGVRKGGIVAILGAVVIYAALVLLFKIVSIREIKSMLKRG